MFKICSPFDPDLFTTCSRLAHYLFITFHDNFLAVMSSSRSDSVTQSVRPFVRPSVLPYPFFPLVCMESLVYLECHKASKSVQGIKLESMGVKRVSQGCLKSVSRLFLGVFRLFQESSRVSFLAANTPNMNFQDFFRFTQKVILFYKLAAPL